MNSQAPKSNFQAKTNFSAEFIQQINQFEPKFDEPIAPFSTWKCGGPADILVIAKNATELEKLVILAIENEIPYTILGHASNILISDNGIRGLVIINKSREVKIMEKPNLIKQEEYSYYLRYFDKITEDCAGENKLENSKIDLNYLKKMWNIKTSNDFFDSHQIKTTEQSEYFEKILGSKPELDKYDYFLELDLIEKTKTSQKINLIFDIYGVVLKDNWLNSEIVQTVEFIKQNHEFYNFYYLSNITKEQFAEFEKLEIFSYFSGGIASFQSDFEKPNSEIFGELLEKFDLKPETSIFIDDTERNVEMAEKIGINGLIYSYDMDLAKEIKKILGEITTENSKKNSANLEKITKQIQSKIQEFETNNSQSQKPFIIAIDGRSGSGKSTIATKFTKLLPNSQRFNLDAFDLNGGDFFSQKNIAKNFELDFENRQFDIKKIKEEIAKNGLKIAILEGTFGFKNLAEINIDLKIWVELEKEIAANRLNNREIKERTEIDPKIIRLSTQKWQIAEDRYLQSFEPQEQADLVISTENGEYQIVKNNLEVLSENQIAQNADEFDIYITPRHSETGDPNFYSFADLDYTETGNGKNNQEIPLEKSEIVFDSGVDLSFAIAWSLQNNLTGLQWFAGIPGTMGGALYNNIHGGTRHFSDNFVSCKVLIPESESESENLPN